MSSHPESSGLPPPKPALLPSNFPPTLQTNQAVHAFYRMQQNARDQVWITVSSPHHGFRSPVVGWGDRWHAAQIVEPWNSQNFDPADNRTWPFVRYQRSLLWYHRDSNRIDHHPVTERIHPRDLFLGPGLPPIPRVSFVVVRWADGRTANEWDYNSWGSVGSNVSDQYISTMFNQAVYPKLGPDYEVLTIFVRTSEDLNRISEQTCMEMVSGRHLAGLYFLWACEFEDLALIQNPPVAGFVHVEQFYNFQKRMESIGIPTRFPHPSHLHRYVISKDAYAHLCMIPDLKLPACVKINKSSVVCDPFRSAQRGLKNLQIITKRLGRDPSLPVGGVAKLGYSWEAMDVRTFETQDQGQSLSRQIQDLFFQPGCTNDSVFVQERVPLDLELRFIAVNGVVRHVAYTAFAYVSQDGLFRDFHKIHSRTEAAKRWFGGDEEALKRAEELCVECIAAWNEWMLIESEQVPPALRYDFIVARRQPGSCHGEEGEPVSIYLGELCEIGFSMMGWKEADREVFGAVVDASLMDKEEHPSPILS